MSYNEQKKGHLILGAILIIAGALFLANNMNWLHYDIPDYIFSFPSIILLVGLIIFIMSDKKLPGIVVLTIGGVAMWAKLDPSVNFGDFIFPIILLLIGSLLVFKRKSTHPNGHVDKNGKVIDEDIIDEVVVFGGNEKYIKTKSFKGGSVTAIFGGSELVLRDSELAEGKNILDLTCLFGGVEMHVPRDWNIKIDIVPIFGGVSNKRKYFEEDTIDEEKVLLIKGVVIFGGGEIKYY